MRYLVVILPFLFYFILIGIECLITKTKISKIIIAKKTLYIVVAIYALGYLNYGVRHFMVKAVAKEHKSPFGETTIKYDWNYDLQELAVWVRDNSSQEDSYVCIHPDVLDMITLRRGCCFPFTYDKSEMIEYFDKKDINYVLIDKRKLSTQKFLIPAIEAYPDRFELIKDEKNASLYRVRR
jgi:hypothetical protein